MPLMIFAVNFCACFYFVNTISLLINPSLSLSLRINILSKDVNMKAEQVFIVIYTLNQKQYTLVQAVTFFGNFSQPDQNSIPN